MKIEKLTENKIRVLIKNEDIEKEDIDFQDLMAKADESQGFFLEILNQAEEELGFYTDGYKLLIEGFSSPEADYVFTITKYLDSKEITRKKVIPKRKQANYNASKLVFAFENFDYFCELCSCINSSNIPIRGLARRVTLYEYQNTYYLILNKVNNSNPNCNTIFATFSEFAKVVNVSNSFENKLIEYGNIIIKRNALSIAIKYFI